MILPASHDLRIDRGHPYRLDLQCYQDQGRQIPVDLTGSQLAAAIVTAVGISIEATTTIVDATAGRVRLDWSADQTQSLPVGHHRWDAIHTDSAGYIRTLLEGSVSCRQPVTNANP